MKLLEEDLRVCSALIYEKRAALLCTYRRTSIPSRKLSRRSGAPWDKHKPEPAKPSSKR